MTQIYVELHHGYGDGYGLVDEDELRSMEPKLSLGGVKLDRGAVKRVIGPPDCDEGIRISARRFVSQWHGRSFVDLATVDELRAAMGAVNDPPVPPEYQGMMSNFPAVSAAMSKLRDKYCAPIREKSMLAIPENTAGLLVGGKFAPIPRECCRCGAVATHAEHLSGFNLTGYCDQHAAF